MAKWKSLKMMVLINGKMKITEIIIINNYKIVDVLKIDDLLNFELL